MLRELKNSHALTNLQNWRQNVYWALVLLFLIHLNE
jgi:hypothetical protein